MCYRIKGQQSKSGRLRLLIAVLIDVKVVSWMLGRQDISFLCNGHMSVYFCDMDRAVAQHFLNISDVHICFQKACSESVPEHMGRNMQVYSRQLSIFLYYPANRLIG